MRYNEVVKDLQNLTNEEIKPYDMSQATGKSSSTFTYKRDNNGHIDREDLKKIYDYAIAKYSNTKIYENKTDDSVMLDYYPEVFGSCGSGIFELNQTKELIAVPKKCFFTSISPIKKYSVINAKGNSMQPSIYENDKLIVEHWNGEQIIDNKPYVFCYKDEIFVKRLAKNVNQLIIISDNRNYDIIKLTGNELSDVIIVGQIVGLMRDLR